MKHSVKRLRIMWGHSWSGFRTLRGFANTDSMACSVSNRAKKIINPDYNYQEIGFARYLDNSYHEKDNPKNKLLFDLLEEKLASEREEIHEEYTQYGKNFNPRFRDAVCNFLNHYMKPVEPIDPNNVLNMGGVSQILNTLGYVICDRGEGILIPSPYFHGFYLNFSDHSTDVVICPVDLHSEPAPGETRPFQLTIAKLEESLEKAKKQNIQVRGLLLTNPQNPLGDVYSEELMRDCLNFAHRHSLHVIFDEVYMLSIFEEGHPPMKCALSLKDIPDKERVHVIWGFSKDLGISGFSCGIMHSWNKEVRSALNYLRNYHLLPEMTQLQLTNLISDLDWLDNVFIPTNHKRLRECHAMLCNFLDRNNIPFLRRGSGLYVWVNLSEFVSPLSTEGEEALAYKLLDRGVSISPGSSFFCAEPGWFRIVFACPVNNLRVGLARLEEALTK